MISTKSTKPVSPTPSPTANPYSSVTYVDITTEELDKQQYAKQIG